jgi:hypothetical protein
MTSHHIHRIIAAQREAEIRAMARPRLPRTSWTDLAPVLSVIAGVTSMLAIAAPSL